MLSEQKSLHENTMLKIERARLEFAEGFNVRTVTPQDCEMFLLGLLNIIAIGVKNTGGITKPLDYILKHYDRGNTLYKYFDGELGYCPYRVCVEECFNTLPIQHKYYRRFNKDLQICVGLVHIPNY